MPEKDNFLHILLVKDNAHDRVAFQRAVQKSDLACSLTVCEDAEKGERLLKKTPTRALIWW